MPTSNEFMRSGPQQGYRRVRLHAKMVERVVLPPKTRIGCQVFIRAKGEPFQSVGVQILVEDQAVEGSYRGHLSVRLAQSERF